VLIHVHQFGHVIITLFTSHMNSTTLSLTR